MIVCEFMNVQCHKSFKLLQSWSCFGLLQRNGIILLTAALCSQALENQYNLLAQRIGAYNSFKGLLITTSRYLIMIKLFALFINDRHIVYSLSIVAEHTYGNSCRCTIDYPLNNYYFQNQTIEWFSGHTSYIGTLFGSILCM